MQTDEHSDIATVVHHDARRCHCINCGTARLYMHCADNHKLSRQIAVALGDQQAVQEHSDDIMKALNKAANAFMQCRAANLITTH